ncbi:MAG TPA: TolC family protein [Microscillaceae bacterium]|jgi:cobalt-zinc-cadmium efflux system outer membrane protein|nr:TolC family protein [Microscillaceae bacterium]
MKKLLSTLVWVFCGACAVAQDGLTLKQAVQLGIRQNKQLQTAAFDVQSAQTDITTAKLRENPVLNNQSLFQTNSVFFPVGTNFQNSLNRQVWYQMTKVFELAGQRKNRIEVANKQVGLAGANYTDLKRNLAYLVAQQWLNVWFAEKSLEIIELASQNLDSLVKINQVRFDKQVITATENERTIILKEQYEISRFSAERAVKSELAQLKLLIGVEGDIFINDNDSLVVPFTQEIDSLIELAQAYRTDLQLAQAVRSLAKSNTVLQKSKAFPAVEAGFIWNPQNNVPYVGTFFTLPLPVFNRNQGEIAKAKILEDQASMQIEAVDFQLRNEIERSFRNYQLQLDNVKRFQQILGQSDDILRTIRYAYIRGSTTIIDFLDAQRSWLDTRKTYYDALLLYRRSYVDVLFSSGLIYLLEE